VNITLIRTKGITQQLKLLTEAVVNLTNLYELHLQHTERLTTHVHQPNPKNLNETHVSYGDPEFSELASLWERKLGRTLTDDESAFAAQVLIDDDMGE
jgi:ribosomal protein S11